MAWTWTMVSPLLMAKCRISLGTVKKLPTFIVCSLLSSKLSPIPTRKVPFSTVTFSSVGCQCAGILDPSAHRIRRTKGAASAFMSPATGATSHPLIIGVHFRSPKRTILCASLLSFLSWLKAAIAGAAIDRKTTSDFATTVFLIRFLRSKDWPDLGAPGLAKRYSRPACEA